MPRGASAYGVAKQMVVSGEWLPAPAWFVVDRRGGAYFTSGGAFYVDATGRVTSLGDDIRANGVMLSPDEKVLYVTNGASVLAWDVDADGSALVAQEDFDAVLKIDATGSTSIFAGTLRRINDGSSAMPITIWPGRVPAWLSTWTG